MAELPTGTVTFLFTDIEGSTALLQELGDRYPAVHDEHAAIIAHAVEGAGGVVVRIEGDAFFVAFRSPGQAVRAAVAAQRGLAAHDWSHGRPLRVRMGLHTGDGVLGGGDYVGIDVNRAARIAAAAHGGQVLLSGATRGLVVHGLPQGASLRDLGEHRLKDIVHAEHLYDVVMDGLLAEFPPPRTLESRLHNFPLQLTSFVGREDEIAEVRTLLARTRLLTLTGAGGTGKSRLALQVAAESVTEFHDGGVFVDLSSLADPALVPSALADALGVREPSGRPIIEALKDHLRDRKLLLVVDNFEQVVEAAAMVEELLAAAPGLKVLATSRLVLSLRGEQEYPVPPLDVPDPGRLPDLPTLCRVEAVRLFTERALAVRPGFRVTEGNAPAVAEIAARLDGLPLAIELAATRVKVLSPEEMLPRLRRSLSLLTSTVRTLPERQRTLRGAIAWSHELLHDAERPLFARLSVFAGGWTLESAEAVCDPEGLGLDPLEGLASLADQSLIRRMESPEGSGRFSMLEAIREYGQDRLRATGELEATRLRHAEHFLDLALEAEPHLTADDQREWLDRCDREHANLRVALRWAIDAGEVSRAQEAAGALWRFWQQRGHLAEGRRWFQEILALPEGPGRTRSRAKALAGAGGIAWWQSDIPGAIGFYEEALAIEREHGDPAGVAEAMYNRAFGFAAQGDAEASTQLLEESLGLFRSVGDESGIARALSGLALSDALASNWRSVIDRQEEAAAFWRRVGDRFQTADGLSRLGVAYARVGEGTAARAALLEALDLFREVGNLTGLTQVILDLSFLASWEGRYTDALRPAGAWESVREAAEGGPPADFLGELVGDPHGEARAQLSEDAAQQAWDEGRSMTVDQAVALARAAAGPARAPRPRDPSGHP